MLPSGQTLNSFNIFNVKFHFHFCHSLLFALLSHRHVLQKNIQNVYIGIDVRIKTMHDFQSFSIILYYKCYELFYLLCDCDNVATEDNIILSYILIYTLNFQCRQIEIYAPMSRMTHGNPFRKLARKRE